jgi:hypothetical protein
MEDPASRVIAQVMRELGEHLEAADAHGASYVRRYVTAALSGRQIRPRPMNMHPKIGELIRELALDALTEDRRRTG